MEECYVYHIHRPGMSLDEGYIGISTNPEYRFSKHKRSKYKVGNCIRKYKDTVMTLLVKGSVEYCLMIENKLRPSPNLGWNLRVGGDVPVMCGKKHTEQTKAVIAERSFKGRTHTEETKQKMRKSCVGLDRWNAKLTDIFDYETDALIASGVIMSQWANENGYNRGNLARTATGLANHHKGVYARYREVTNEYV